jgi:heptosyltransferase III
MKILFVTSTRIGDAILSTGLLGRLLDDHPEARVTIACGPAAASLFESVDGLERLIVLDKMVLSLHWLRLWSLCVFSYWDILVDLRNAPLTYLLFAAKRQCLGRKRNGAHRVRQLASVLGLDPPPPPRLWASQAQKDAAKDLIPEGGPVLAIGPTANWRAKTWRPQHFAKLVKRICAKDGLFPNARIALFGRDDERPMALPLIDAIPAERRIDLIGKLDLSEAYACLGRCDFYIGNDSGLMHLAAAANIPTLGLFGPSPDALYAPWGKHCAAVRTPESYENIFPKNFNHITSDSLMDSLSVEAVEDAARALLNSTGKSAR